MKPNHPQDPLKKVLKQYGTLAPSEPFSARLKNMVVTSYKLSYTRRYRKEERLGKYIIGVLLLSCLLILVEMKPSATLITMLIPVFAGIVGLFLLILMLRKAGNSNIPPD